MLGGNSLGNATGIINLDVSGVETGVNTAMGSLQQLDNVSAGGLDGFAAGIKQNEQQIRGMGRGLTIFGAAATAAFVAPLKSAASFEQVMNNVRALSGANADQFQMLQGRATELASTTKYTSNEIAEAMSFLAMAGYEVEEIYGTLPGVLNLAAAANMDLGRAADVTTNIMTAFAIEAEHMELVSDKLTYGFTNSNTSMEQMADAIRYAGPVASSAGISLDELVAAVGMLGDAGFQGSQAGTILRGAITKLISPTNAAQKVLDGLGVSTTNSSGQMLPLYEILNQFPPITNKSVAAVMELSTTADSLGIAMENVDGTTRPVADVLADLDAAGIDTTSMLGALGTEADTVAAVMDIFGLRAGPGMLALLAQGGDALKIFTEEIENSGGTAERVANIQLEGLMGSLNLLRAVWESVAIRMMNAGPLQALNKIVLGFKGLLELILLIPAPILGVMAAITGLSGVIMGIAGVSLLALPRIANMIIAFRGLAATGGVLGGAVGRIMGFADALIRLSGVLKWILPGLGLLLSGGIFAYSQNILGFGDWIDSQVNKATSAWDSFRQMFGATVNETLTESKFTSGSMFDGTIFGEDGTGPDGRDWFVLGPEGERFGEILESYKDEDGTIRMRVEMDDGSEQWLEQGPDGVTEWADSVETVNSTIQNSVSRLEGFNNGIDTIQGKLRTKGVGFLNPLLDGFRNVVNFGAGAVSGIKGFGGWFSSFNELFVKDRRIFGGMEGVTRTIGDSLQSAWSATRPFDGFWRDVGDALFMQKDADGQFIPVGDRIANALGMALDGAGLGFLTPFAHKVLSGLGTAFGAIGGSVSAIGRRVSSALTSGVSFFKGFGTALSGMWSMDDFSFIEKLGYSLANALHSAGLEGAAARVAQFTNTIGTALGRVTGTVRTFVAMFRISWNMFGKSAGPGSMLAITGLTVLDKLFASLAAGFRAIGWDAAADAVDRLGLRLQGLRGVLSGMADDIRSAWSYLRTTAIDDLREQFSRLGPYVDIASSALGVFFGHLRRGEFGDIFEGIMTGFDALKAGFGAATSFISNALSSIGTFVWNMLIGKPAFIGGFDISTWLTNVIGTAVEWTLTVGLDLIINFLNEPEKQGKRLLLATLASSFAILSVTGGIVPALALLGIAGLGVLATSIIKRVVDYFRSSPEARAEIQLRIGKIWTRLEDIPILGLFFTVGRLVYSHFYLPIYRAIRGINNFLSEHFDAWNYITERLGRMWMGMAGLNLLERLGSSAFLGTYMKQVGDTRQAVRGLEAALYGLLKLFKLPFEFTFRPLNLLKQVLGGTNARETTKVLNQMLAPLMRGVSEGIFSPEDAARALKNIRLMESATGNTTKNFRALQRIGGLFAAGLRLSRAVIASFLSPVRTLVDNWGRITGSVAAYRRHLDAIYMIARGASGLAVDGIALDPKQLSEYTRMYRHFVATYGDFNIRRIWETPILDADNEFRALRGSTEAVRRDLGKVFSFIAKHEGNVGQFGFRSIMAWPVALERTIANALQRRGGLAGMLYRVLLWAPVELPAKLLNRVFNLDTWMKGGFSFGKGSTFARPLRDWVATALDPESMNFARREQVMNQRLRQGMWTIQQRWGDDLKLMGGDFYRDMRRAFSPGANARMGMESVDIITKNLADMVMDLDQSTARYVDKLSDLAPSHKARYNRALAEIQEMIMGSGTGPNRTLALMDGLDDAARINRSVPQIVFGRLAGSLRAAARFFGKNGLISPLVDGISDAARGFGRGLRDITGVYGMFISNWWQEMLDVRTPVPQNFANRALAGIDAALFQAGRIQSVTAQRAINNIFANIDFTKPVDDIQRGLSRDLGRLRGLRGADQAQMLRIVEESFQFRGTRMQRLFSAVFDPRVAFADPRVMRMGGMFESILLGPVRMLGRLGGALTDIGTGPLRFFGTQMAAAGRNFDTVANIFAKVWPRLGAGRQVLDEFGSVLRTIPSMGARAAVAFTAASVASFLWSKNIFGLQDAFGGVTDRIGMGIRALYEAFGEDGMAGVINTLIDGVDLFRSDIPGALSMVANSPAWEKIFAAFGIFGGMFIGGPLGLALAVFAPLIAKAATGVVGSIGRIASAWDKNGLDGAVKAFGRETSLALGGAGRWFQSFGQQLIDVGDAFGRIPVIGGPLQRFFGAAGTLARSFGFSLLDLQGNFDAARDQGMNPFEAGLSALVKQFPSFGRGIRRVSRFSKALSAGWNAAGKSAGSLTKIMGPVERGIDAVSFAFRAMGWDTAANIVDGLGDAWQRMQPSLSGLLGPLGRIRDSFGLLFSGDVTGFAKELVLGVRDLATGIGDVIIASSELRGELIEGIFDRLSDAFPDMADGFGQMGTGLGQINEAVADIVRGLQALLSGDISGALSEFGSAISNIWSGIGNIASGAWTALTEVDWDAIGNEIATALGAIDWPTVLADVAQAIIDGLRAAALGLAWVLEVAVPTVTGWLADLGTWFAEEIWPTIDWDGITEGLRNFANSFIASDSILVMMMGFAIRGLAEAIDFFRGHGETLKGVWDGLMDIFNFLMGLLPEPVREFAEAISQLAKEIIGLVAAYKIASALGLIPTSLGGRGIGNRGIGRNRGGSPAPVPNTPTSTRRSLPRRALDTGASVARKVPGGARTAAAWIISAGAAAARSPVLRTLLGKLSVPIAIATTLYDTANQVWGDLQTGLDHDPEHEARLPDGMRTRGADNTMYPSGYWDALKEQMLAGQKDLGSSGMYIDSNGKIVIAGMEADSPGALLKFLKSEGVTVAPGDKGGLFGMFTSSLLGRGLGIELGPAPAQTGSGERGSRTAQQPVTRTPRTVSDSFDRMREIPRTSTDGDSLARLVRNLIPPSPAPAGGGGGGIFGPRSEPTPFAGGTELQIDAIRGSAPNWISVLGASTGQQAAQTLGTSFGVVTRGLSGVATQAPLDTDVMRNAVTTNFGTAASVLVDRSGLMRDASSGAFGSISASGLLRSGETSQSWTTNSALMAQGATSSTSSMSAGMAGSFAGISASASLQTMAARMSTSTNTGAMADAGVGSAARMSSGMTGSISGISGNIAGQTLRWVAIVLMSGGTMAAAGASVGRALGNGVAAGMDATLNRIRAAANRIISTALSAMVFAAMVNSPSHLFRDQVGVFITSGTAAGMTSPKALRGIRKSAEQMVSYAETRAAMASHGASLAMGHQYGYMPASSQSYNDNRTIGDINVTTQATDADGTATAVMDALHSAWGDVGGRVN